MFCRDAFFGDKDIAVVWCHALDVRLDRLAHQANRAMAHDTVPHFLACRKTDFDVAQLCTAIDKGQDIGMRTASFPVYIVKLFPLLKPIPFMQQGFFFLLPCGV